jgi:NAD(P)-dependent dehydrogenase (short-subunit alcohol dehydrogenase family)
MSDEPPRALVSGGSSGIGAAIARGFAAEGAEAHATGASQDEAQAAAARPEMADIRCQALDVRDAAAVAEWVGALGDLDHCLCHRRHSRQCGGAGQGAGYIDQFVR